MAVAAAWRELADAFRHYPLWTALGTMEIKHRYKRSVLGPFWITINMGALIFGIGYIYANVFASLHSSYIPYLASGIVAWNLISGVLLEGANAFIAAGPVIKNVTISKFIHVLHVVWRNFLIFLHNVLIVIPVYIIYDSFPGWGVLAVIPGALALLAFLLAGSMFLAVLSARYRDVPPAAAGLIQLAFFATPIIWEAQALTRNVWIVTYNPFFHLVECVRAPLLEGAFPLTSVAITLVMSGIVFALALLLYARNRQKIVFWL